MGNHDAGRAVGEAADKAYRNRKPGETALQILDRVCEPWRGFDAEFEAVDPDNPRHVHPVLRSYRQPHPAAGLGMLMIEAFAPGGAADFDRYQKANDPDGGLFWNEVIEPFKARYRFC